MTAPEDPKATALNDDKLGDVAGGISAERDYRGIAIEPNEDGNVAYLVVSPIDEDGTDGCIPVPPIA